MEIKMNHAPDRTVAGYVVRTNMAVDAKKGVSYSVKIRCEQCGWTHWLEVNEEQYQQALEAMNSGAITTDAFNDLRHCLYYAVEAGAFEDGEQQGEEQIPW